MSVNPPRPTSARLRALLKKLDRVVEDINLMTRGNTMSADSHKLHELRQVRNAIEVKRDAVERLLGVKA